MKNHLRRVAGPRRLTYEEFSTVLVEIEAVLNNSPLSPLSDGPDDLDPLTPAHFLVGSSLASFPQPSSQDVVLDRLSHWDLVKGMRDYFWTRWAREYLHSLQQRAKWQRPRDNLAINNLVVIIDPSLIQANGR